MSIYIVTGKPRHGKTFFIVRQIPGWLKNGERIFSNVKLSLGSGILKDYGPELEGDLHKEIDLKNPDKQVFYWRNLHDWNVMEKGIIICDEAQRYFRSRNWAQLSEDTELKLQMHGKDDLDVWGTTQHQNRIDVALRELVELYYKTEMTFGSPDNERGPVFGLLPKRAHYEAWTYEEIERIERLGKKALEDDDMIPSDKISYWIRKKFYSIYDTRAKVGKSEPMPLIHKKRICSVCGFEKIEHV